MEAQSLKIVYNYKMTGMGTPATKFGIQLKE